MLVRNQVITLLLIYFQYVINFKVISKNILGPDNTCQGTKLATLLEIAGKYLLCSKFIFKSFIGPEDMYHLRDLRAWMDYLILLCFYSEL